MPQIPSKDEATPGYRQVALLECSTLIIDQHYSHRIPSSVKLCYGDVVIGPPRELSACCVFSIATGRWPEDLWELTRLVRLPKYNRPLTKLLSKAMGYIRQHKLIDLVVSFADSEEDHHGGIYQACSWVYDGLREKRLDGFNIDGEFVPARTCNALYGTSSETALPEKLKGKKVEPHYDSGKHCYWKAVSKEGMQKAMRLGLKSQAYPKPMLDNNSEANYAVDQQRRKGIIPIPGVTAPQLEVKVKKLNTANEL